MISFRELEDSDNDFKKLYNWCQNKFVYEWFEQRKLSYEEIYDKYHNKLLLGKQKLLIIQYDNKDIGLVQIYKYDDREIEELNRYQNIYEYDIFIGEEDYLSKGIGQEVIKLINHKILLDYGADAIVLRPFKNNTRAINCYKKCGFKVIYEYIDKDTIGNTIVINVLLYKKITRKYLQNVNNNV